MATERSHFVAPVIEDNPNGWGPTSVSDAFKGIPYQPFSKADRLGKISDWSGTSYQDRRYQNKYLNQFGGGSQYAYYHEEDESSFHLVDTSRPQKPVYMRNRARFNQRNLKRDRERQMQRQQAGMQNLMKSRDKRLNRKLQKQYANRSNWHDRRNQGPQKFRNASVMVKEEWKVVEEMDFPRLSKLSLPNVPEPDDLVKCGELEYYDKVYDRVNIKNEVPLAMVNRVFHKVTTTDDPIIRKLLSKGNVFATDAIISTLMTCSRSVYSWDIIVQRVGKKLFFDKRDDSAFDLLTVNETAVETPTDDSTEKGINSATNLALEATFINQNFSQQVLKRSEEPEKFDEPNPFVVSEENAQQERVASVGYRYRKWNLGDNIEVVVRCEHDAVLAGGTYINVKALNEWESKAGVVDWRQKLDTQRGAVLATELKNNGCKLAKWTVASVLSGSEYLKIGYVSRKNFLDSTKHCILGTQQFRPRELASQMNLSMDNGWGIIRCIVDYCMNFSDGKYLILKDPNKGIIRIYDIPNNTFESDDDEEDEEEDEDDDEEADDEEDDQGQNEEK